MTTEIHSGNISKSPFLRSYVENQLSKLEKYGLDRAKADVWLNSEGSVDGGGASTFSVKLRLKRPNGRDYFVKKTADDFFHSLNRSLRAVDRLLRKEKNK